MLSIEAVNVIMLSGTFLILRVDLLIIIMMTAFYDLLLLLFYILFHYAECFTLNVLGQ
jgi:hypothetical protein